MQVTYSQIESLRRKWTPYPMASVPFESTEGNIPIVLQKCIALGLFLELPVGEWIASATKKELPISREARTTLGRNINDERVHYDGLMFAAAAYPIDEAIMKYAQTIGKQWEDHPAHPLEKAALAETGVFLTSLTAMILFGGRSLANLATDISRDEQRHVAVNRGILYDMGFTPHSPSYSLASLFQATNAFLFDGFKFSDMGIDQDWMREQSELLVTEGSAPELSEITSHSTYAPPFEVGNYLSYCKSHCHFGK